jgi:endonuclease YncB( thermonuclease family)
MRALTVLVLLLLALPAHAQQQQVDGLATVNDDGSLTIGGTDIRLFGITIPKLGILCIDDFRGRTCSDFNIRRTLERKINGFVHCQIVDRAADGVLEGICTIEGRDRFRPRQDLGAWLVNQGMAVALRNAPPEYEALQQIAKARDVGVWSGLLVPEDEDWGDDSRF